MRVTTQNVAVAARKILFNIRKSTLGLHNSFMVSGDFH